MLSEDCSMMVSNVQDILNNYSEHGSFNVNRFNVYGSDDTLESAAPAVEFETRHAREHLTKLKSTWLEMTSKSGFLEGLSDVKTWSECGTLCYTPGDLKKFESSEVDPAKHTLSKEKAVSENLSRVIREECENAVASSESFQNDYVKLAQLLDDYKRDVDCIEKVSESLPAGILAQRSAEEVDKIFSEQRSVLEKRALLLERQRASVADLERLLRLNETEMERLQSSLATAQIEIERLDDRNENQDSKAGKSFERKIQSELCQWYNSVFKTLGEMTCCSQVEMVDASHLIVSISIPMPNGPPSRVPLHVTIDSKADGSVALVDARVGNVSGTPKRQWKLLVDAAILFNDLPFLVRSVAASGYSQ